MKIRCERCNKLFKYENTYRLCNDDAGSGREIVVCHSCLSILWKTIITISKKIKE